MDGCVVKFELNEDRFICPHPNLPQHTLQRYSAPRHVVDTPKQSAPNAFSLRRCTPRLGVNCSAVSLKICHPCPMFGHSSSSHHEMHVLLHRLSRLEALIFLSFETE